MTGPYREKAELLKKRFSIGQSVRIKGQPMIAPVLTIIGFFNCDNAHCLYYANGKYETIQLFQENLISLEDIITKE